MQRETFRASDWREATGMVECRETRDGTGVACTVSVRMTPPSVVALWVRAQ